MTRRVLLLLWASLLLGPTWGIPLAHADTEAGAGWPVSGRVAVVRGFEPPVERWLRGHRGIDLAVVPGQPVLAAAAGRVTLARPVAGRGVVVVQHGELRTTYEPVEGLVLPGQWVSRGDVLGRVGHQSHCPTLTCLHWGLRRGDAYLDPRTLLLGSASPLRLLPATAADLVTRRSAERAERDEAMAAGAGRVMAHHRGAGRHGFRRPVPGPVSSPFGRRFHPIRQVWSLHDGTDFTAPCGAPIAAAYDGVVRQRNWHPAYGQRLIIDHGRVDGSLVSTAYNHAARYVARPGQRVARGEIIGYVGSTGLSTGCHLHLMLWLDGRLADPLSWL